MKRLFLHLDFIKMKYASRLAYRFDFITSALAMFSLQIIGPLFVGAIYYSGGQFPGWGLYEMLFLIGTFTLVKGFAFMAFFGILWNTQEHVRHGTLELLLIKPVSTLWLLIMDSFDEEDIGQVAGGLAVSLFALYHLGSFQGSILLYFFFLLFGLLFFFGLALLVSALAIKFVNIFRFYEIIDILTLFANYPKTVYSRTLGVLLTAAFPLMIVAFFPASALLGMTLELVIPGMISVILFALLGLAVWHKTLKAYSGAGG